MQSRFVKADAEAMVATYAAKEVPRDLALRVYTTRLLGGDPRLVLHGGGNTSVKTRASDLMGREVDVLCVKGSGADMAVIEPAGLPAVRLGRIAHAAWRATRCPTRRWCGCSAPTCWTRWRPILPSRRCCTPSSRTNSWTTPIPPRC